MEFIMTGIGEGGDGSHDLISSQRQVQLGLAVFEERIGFRISKM